MGSGTMTLLPVMRRFLLTFLLAGVVGAAQEGSEVVSTPPPSVITSSSGRFIVTGPDAIKTSEYTRWAEAMAERLEHRLGVSLAFTRQSPLRIRLASAGAATVGIDAQCEYREGHVLYCSLAVNEYVPLDYEELLAVWCRLALVSLADRDGGHRDNLGELPRVPQWLAVGLAQNLDPALCARNRRLMQEAMSQSRQPEVSRVLSWDSLPERWYRMRAVCGMTVLWLDSLKPQGESWRMVLDRLAAGEPVTVGWVATALAGVESGAALETVWSHWLKGQERVVQDLGAVSSVTLNQLREMVEVPTSELGDAAPADRVGRLSPIELIPMRESLAVRLAAEERMQKVQALTIGKAPELIQVGQAYAIFFEGVARGASAWRLRWRLRRAEQSLVALLELTQAREAYVDAFERAASGRHTAGMSSPPVLDKSRLEAYVDSVEKKVQPDGE